MYLSTTLEISIGKNFLKNFIYFMHYYVISNDVDPLSALNFQVFSCLEARFKRE